jgi:hypothetical protein
VTRRRPALLLLALALGSAACGGAKSPSSPSSPAGCSPTAGTTCFGQQNYVEYNGGDLPIVVSVPHGGAIAPATIPDRTGTTVTDLNTIELGRAIVEAFRSRTGRTPHLVLCQLRRTKLDANREVGDAAQGNAAAGQAWTEYHAFIEMATAEVVRRSSRGIYVDLHGHGHAIQRLELGYLLSDATLGQSDAQLDAGGAAQQSSLRRALPFTSVSFSAMLRGTTSLGGLLAARTPSVPSPATPSPSGDPYFEGGYSTERHTATLPGLQIEAHLTGIRDTAANRASFADALVDALRTFAQTHLGLSF